MTEHPGELDLMAYADGELDAAGQEARRQYLASHPGAERKIEAYIKYSKPGVVDGGCRRACGAFAEVGGA